MVLSPCKARHTACTAIVLKDKLASICGNTFYNKHLPLKLIKINYLPIREVLDVRFCIYFCRDCAKRNAIFNQDILHLNQGHHIPSLLSIFFQRPHAASSSAKDVWIALQGLTHFVFPMLLMLSAFVVPNCLIDLR